MLYIIKFQLIFINLQELTSVPTPVSLLCAAGFCSWLLSTVSLTATNSLLLKHLPLLLHHDRSWSLSRYPGTHFLPGSETLIWSLSHSISCSRMFCLLLIDLLIATQPIVTVPVKCCGRNSRHYYHYLPPTTEEVNAIARDVCLSVCLLARLLKDGFGWHFVCRQVSGHGRTDQLLSQIGSYSGCRNQIAFSDIVCIATRNFITSGKSHIQVLGMVIWCLSQQRCVVLRRQNTVVGGKCAIPSALLVLFVNGSWTHNDEMCNLYVMYYAENGWKPYFTCISNSFPDLFKDIPADNDVPLSPNAWLNAVATGHVHKGTVSTVILPACCVLLCTDPRYLHLATSELWCRSGGRGILTERSLCYSFVFYCNSAQQYEEILEVDWLDRPSLPRSRPWPWQLHWHHLQTRD